MLLVDYMTIIIHIVYTAAVLNGSFRVILLIGARTFDPHRNYVFIIIISLGKRVVPKLLLLSTFFLRRSTVLNCHLVFSPRSHHPRSSVPLPLTPISSSNDFHNSSTTLFVACALQTTLYYIFFVQYRPAKYP